MKELQIPTRQIRVELFCSSGEHMEGILFAPELPNSPGQTEHLLGLLNDKRDFLPVGPIEPEGDGTILNKRYVTRVRLAGPGAAFEFEIDLVGFEGGVPVDAEDESNACTLYLSDGSVVRGHLALETPWAASRLLDKLNMAPDFVPLVTADGVEFIQRSHFVRVE